MTWPWNGLPLPLNRFSIILGFSSHLFCAETDNCMLSLNPTHFGFSQDYVGDAVEFDMQ